MRLTTVDWPGRFNHFCEANHREFEAKKREVPGLMQLFDPGFEVYLLLGCLFICFTYTYKAS